MLELYHYEESTAAQKVRIALAEKGLRWQSRIIDKSLARREQHDPDYLKLNPRGLVPTLIHDGQVIRESQVILEYLEDAFPEPALRPADPLARAHMRLWTKAVDEGLHVDSRVIGVCIVNRHTILKGDAEILERHYAAMPEDIRRENDQINIAQGLASPLLPKALRRFKKLFREMDEALARSPWLAGDAYSLADISLVVYATRLESFQMAPLWDGLVHLGDWHGRNKERASYIAGVTEWGDATSPSRIKYGRDAFPTVKALWRAA